MIEYRDLGFNKSYFLTVERDDSIEDIASYLHMTTNELLEKIQAIVDDDIKEYSDENSKH